jgi:hypothetical protein
MNTSQSRVNTTSPPPINWATKPNRRPPNSVNTPQHHAEESGTATSRPQLDIDTNDIGNLQQALRYDRFLDGRDDRFLDGRDERFIDGRDERFIDGRQPTSEVDGLTLCFSRLSVTPATMNYGAALLDHPLTARTVPATIAVVSHGRRKYYVVVVGKCTGVYYDVW